MSDILPVLAVLGLVVLASCLVLFALLMFVGDGTTYCPQCGLPTVRYVDSFNRNGYIIERRWRACPAWRDEGPGWQDHFGVWEKGDQRSEYDPNTGKRRT